MDNTNGLGKNSITNYYLNSIRFEGKLNGEGFSRSIHRF